MAVLAKARKSAAAALLAAALSIPAAHSAAAAATFASVTDPTVAALRLATFVRDIASDWPRHAGALRSALVERIAYGLSESRRQFARAAIREAPATTGSIVRGANAAEGSASKSRPELLASVALPYGRLPALARMKPIYSDIKAGLFGDCRTATCENARATLSAVIEHGKQRKFLDLIDAVNRSVNKLVAYRRDSDRHGAIDVWSKPSETLGAGLGDCEDYAIVKMAVLQTAGIPQKSMSLVVLRDEGRNVYHAVLAISTSRGAYILDNLSEVVRRDTALPDYMPLYSVSAGRGYIYGRRTGASALSASLGRLDGIAPGEGFDLGAATRLPAPAEMRGPL